MKNLLKKLLTKESLILLAILAITAIIRFYNFKDRVVYGPEQAISLISASQNLKTPSLLGIPYLLRTTSSGLELFTAPFFGYSLIPFILLLNYNVFAITAVFALLNLMTGIVLYFISKKMFGQIIAIFSIILFLFNDYMIYHSLFIWISNYMPIVGILTFYFFFQFVRSKKHLGLVFILGLLAGIGFGIEYIYLFVAFSVFLLVVVLSKQKLQDGIIYIIGGLVGELPTVIFDLKHNFYNFKTLYQYLLDTLKNPGQSQISYYHFLFFWPIAAVLLAILLKSLFKTNKYFAVILLTLYIYINLTSSRISFTHAVGMPYGLTAQNVLDATSYINKDNPKNFNLTVLMNFDNRGYVLRYPLEFMYNKNALSVEDYPKSDTIYVLALKKYDFTKPDIWEVKSFAPFSVSSLAEVNNRYSVFKLSKKK